MVEHLLPAAREIALLSAEQRIMKLRSDYWIGYSGAEQALNKLENLLIHPKKTRMPNMLIISPTNNGKTMIVEKFRRNHLPYDNEEERRVVPVMMVQMPPSPSVHKFYASLLMADSRCAAPYPATTSRDMTALWMLKVKQTKVLIIDELHNILAGNANKQREFLNIFRYIGNELQISIVGVGIKDAYFAIRSDDQLENRFEPFILPLWKDDNEFTRLLASFIKIMPLRRFSNLLEPDIRSMILERSEGTIGEISTLLIQAACEAISSGKEYIDLEILEQVDYRSPSERRRLYESIIRQ